MLFTSVLGQTSLGTLQLGAVGAPPPESASLTSNGAGGFSLIGAIALNPVFEADGAGGFNLIGTVPAALVADGMGGFSLVNPILQKGVIPFDGAGGFRLFASLPGTGDGDTGGGVVPGPQFRENVAY